MSFFSDFFDLVKVEEVKNQICCDMVFGKKIRLVGNFKIDLMADNEIVLKVNKIKYRIFGTDLTIFSISKGEMEIVGNISGVVKE